VRTLPGGAIEFLGRADNQVKLRGFRIELGEIEAALADLASIRDVVVLMREDIPGDSRLAAYVVLQPGESLDVAAVRRSLRDRLPDYMVPAAFVVMDTLPLNENGKVDRRALPEPDARRPESDGQFVKPRDETEAMLAIVWEEVLGRGPIGLRDNFFELGGHSLLAARLFARMEARFGKSLPLDSLFHAPTLEEQAGLLREPWRATRKRWMVAVQPSGTKPPLFFAPPAASPALVFAALARHLGKDQPLYGLAPPDIDGDVAIATWFVDSAARYVEEIRSVQPTGPYLVGGSCFGGLMAYEVAQLLVRQGEKIARLVLIDPGSPLTRDSLEYYFRRGASYCRYALYPRLTGRPEHEYVVIPHHRPPIRFDLLYGDKRDQAPQGQKVWDLNLRGAAHHVTRPYPGEVTLIQSMQHHVLPEIQRGWSRLAGGGLDYHVIDARHLELLREPKVGALASVIAECLSDASVVDA
ncbi:MAG: non-ribosomal peptide synthetase, partial [Gemmatimonadaceae bacterium]|nr:non-ribosomal peptide synthetase [Gemmatimonadaceae bacterium]